VPLSSQCLRTLLMCHFHLEPFWSPSL
jgi:hypothetical protein